MRLSQVKNKKIIFYLIFICLLYPLIHNLFMFAVVYFGKFVFNYENTYFNLILLGWKEVFLYLLLSILLFFNKSLSHFFLLSLLILSLFLSSITFLKELFLPFLTVFLIMFNCEKIQIIFKENLRFILKWIITISFISLIFGYSDLIIRTLNEAGLLNYYDFNYLVTLNKIKCTKSAITSSLEFYNSCVYGTAPNFYKIFISDNLMYRQQVMFMPAGDSVTLSYIYLYLTLLLIYIKSFKNVNINYLDILIFLIVLSQIFTFNRVNIFFTVLIYSYFGLKNKKVISLIIIYSIIVYNFENIFLSIFDPRLPSNIGHLEGLKNIIGLKSLLYDVSMEGLIISIITVLFSVFLFVKIKLSQNLLFVVFILLNISLMSLINFTPSLLGTKVSFPTESNLLKIMYSYGIVGVVIYSYILSILASNIREKSFYSKILSINLITYQLISPYIISGFVIFMPAILIISILKNINTN